MGRSASRSRSRDRRHRRSSRSRERHHQREYDDRRRDRYEDDERDRRRRDDREERGNRRREYDSEDRRRDGGRYKVDDDDRRRDREYTRRYSDRTKDEGDDKGREFRRAAPKREKSEDKEEEKKKEKEWMAKRGNKFLTAALCPALPTLRISLRDVPCSARAYNCNALAPAILNTRCCSCGKLGHITEECRLAIKKPNFEVSGLLAEEQNSKNGIALMFSQPPDATMPTDAWRLYENRDDAQNGEGDKILHIHRKSCYLFGKDRRLTDSNDEDDVCFVPIDHPTCSRQHAVIQFRLRKGISKPYLLDLGGKNGTFVNEKRVPAAKYYELREGDLIKFAHSSKSYVLLSAGPLKNKEDNEGEDDDEIDFGVLEDSPQLQPGRGGIKLG
ncbi:hypothetical protein FOL47_007895 [Perkinsus chesapeaki]|uniref:FHA domain-containing protein n=1 Tax=Perkinsus chesapeaki TaxID=330153 RepID=A0A7J6LH67_PERCH|nr:hypothetical protein FOL47_007895 [Perkinsus chesapeaki]